MKKTILGLFLGMSVMGMAMNNESAGTTESTTSKLSSTSTTYTEVVGNDLHIKATVIKPLTIVEHTSMEFGKIISGQAANSTTAGVMDISGDKGAEIVISIETSAEIVGPENTSVTVKLEPSGTKKANLSTEDGTLSQIINGSIKANATKEAGNYAGTTTIKVKYN